MKKYIILFFLVQLYLYTNSQNILKSPVIIYSISENSVIKRNGEEIKLDSLLVCNLDEELEIVKGKVYAYNGSEIYLKPGDKVNIVRKKNAKPNDIDKVSRFINEPSVHLPNLYNNTRSSSLNVFPEFSAVFNVKNIDIVIPLKLHNKLNWKLFSASNDSLIIKIEKVAKDFIPDTLKLAKNQTYYWKLYNENTSFTGQIKILKNLKSEVEIPNKLNNKADYFKTFNIFIQNNCIFDAIHLLEEGERKFPDCKILQSLLLKFPYQ